MGYKKYSDIASAEEMLEHIKRGNIGSRQTAYRELVTIINEWPRTPVAREAQRMIDADYSDLVYMS